VDEIQEGRISTGLDYLDFTSDFPDCAENVEKVGALAVLVGLISSEDSLVVRRSLEVLNMYLPNNPRIQLSAALRYECLPALKSALKRHETNNDITHLCFSVMGSLIRNVAPLEGSFIREGYVSYIVRIAESTSDMKTIQKVISIVSSLANANDLKSTEAQLKAFVLHIYGNHGTSFTPHDIQFWELASRLSLICDFGTSCRDIFLIRKTWIQSQVKEVQNEYSTELEVLNALQ
jgi:hypothetical protein